MSATTVVVVVGQKSGQNEAAMAAMSLIKGTCFRGPRRIKRRSLRNVALVFDDDDDDKLTYMIPFCQQTSKSHFVNKTP